MLYMYYKNSLGFNSRNNQLSKSLTRRFVKEILSGVCVRGLCPGLVLIPLERC